MSNGISVLTRPARSLPRDGCRPSTSAPARQMFGEIAWLGVPRGGFVVAVADHDGRGGMKANDQVPAPQSKLAHGFLAFTADDSPRGRTLLLPRPKDGQNRAINSGILENVGSKCQMLGSETRERGMSDERNQCCSSTQSIWSPLH
jgi:hypothetical protein